MATKGSANLTSTPFPPEKDVKVYRRGDFPSSAISLATPPDDAKPVQTQKADKLGNLSLKNLKPGERYVALFQDDDGPRAVQFAGR